MENFFANLFFFVVSVFALGRVLRFYSLNFERFVKLEKSNPHPHKELFISIIIPCRNEEKRLPKLIESLKNQTYKNFEVIVVDDGSEDGTRELARKYGLRLLIRKEIFKDWEGKSAACYAGAIFAKGRVLLFLDADVFLEKNAIEYLVSKFSEDIVLSCAPYHYIEKFYENLSAFFNLIPLIALRLGNLAKPFNTNNGLYGPCIMISRELYFKTGGHKLVANSIIEDVDLGIELSKRGIPIFIIPHGMVIKFRMYPDGIKYLADGWTKNILLGASRTKPAEIIMVTSIIAVSIGSIVSLLKYLIQKNLLFSSIYFSIYTGFGIFLFIVLRRIGKFSSLIIFAHPIFAIFFTFILLRSLYLKATGGKIYWRKREIKL